MKRSIVQTIRKMKSSDDTNGENESAYLRRESFRATSGLSLEEQSKIVTKAKESGNKFLEKLQEIKSSSKVRKKNVQENIYKYEWLHENNRLIKLHEGIEKCIEGITLNLLNDGFQEKDGYSIQIGCNRYKSPSKPSLKQLKSNHIQSTQKQENERDTKTSPHSEIFQQEIDTIVNTKEETEINQQRQKYNLQQQIKSLRSLLCQVREERQNYLEQEGNQTDISNGSDEWLKNVKKQLEMLIKDSITGHDMLLNNLDEEYEKIDQECSSACESVMKSLREEREKIMSNDSQQNEIAELVLSLNGTEIQDELLISEAITSFQQLHESLEKSIKTCYEEVFANSSANSTFLTGMDSTDGDHLKYGGWNKNDQDRFLKVHKECEVEGIVRKDKMMKKLAMILQMKTGKEIEDHLVWYNQTRLYQTKRKECISLHQRKKQEMMDKYRSIFEKEKKNMLENAERIKEYNLRKQKGDILKAKLEILKDEKESKDRLLSLQKELEDLTFAQELQEQQDKKEKEMEHKKKLLQEYKEQQAILKLQQEERQAAIDSMNEEKKKQQTLINQERIEYRNDELMKKHEMEKLNQQEKIKEQERKIKALEEIVQSTPYAEKIASIQIDSERTRAMTDNFRYNVESVGDVAPIHETGLFPSKGYTCDKLFKDARFKLGIALREAGLHTTVYAQAAMESVENRKSGAYRHLYQPSQGLW